MSDDLSLFILPIIAIVAIDFWLYYKLCYKCRRQIEKDLAQQRRICKLENEITQLNQVLYSFPARRRWMDIEN